MTPVTLTRCPERTVGLKVEARAAASAAALSNTCPLTARADATLPSSSIKTWTRTAPAALTALAAGGYGGLTKLIALPLTTPPETTLGTRGLVKLAGTTLIG